MKPYLPFVLATLFFLSGCPDNKVPKAPPKAPEPKAETVATPIPSMVAIKSSLSGPLS
jgi:hypothetical protein